MSVSKASISNISGISGLTKGGRLSSNQRSFQWATCSGGTEATYASTVFNNERGKTYRTHYFVASGTLQVLRPGFAEVLIIAGGGGGCNGSNQAGTGQGGLGGIVQYQDVIFLDGGSIPITIGSGGTRLPRGALSWNGTATTFGKYFSATTSNSPSSTNGINSSIYNSVVGYGGNGFENNTSHPTPGGGGGSGANDLWNYTAGRPGVDGRGGGGGGGGSSPHGESIPAGLGGLGSVTIRYQI